MTWSHTCTGVNLCLIVGFVLPNGSTLSAVTYAGVNMTQLKTITVSVSGQNQTVYIYGLLAPTTGANTVSVTWTGSVSAGFGGSVSYVNVKQSGLPDSSGSGSVPASTSLTISTTTVADRSIAVAFVASFSAFSGTPAGTGSILIGTAGIGALFESSSFPITPAGSYSMSTNNSSIGQSAGVIISLAPSAVAYVAPIAAGAFTFTGIAVSFLGKAAVAAGQFLLTGFTLIASVTRSLWTNTTKGTTTWTDETKNQ